MINILGTVIGLIIFLFFGFKTAKDFGFEPSLKIPSLPFIELKKKADLLPNNNGGRGGNATVIGNNGTAIGGKGGGSGPGGKGGDGGDATAIGDGSFVMGGEGGEVGQLDRGGKGGRGPLQVLMEDFPEKWKEISKTFGLTEEDAKKYGKGGDGASPVK